MASQCDTRKGSVRSRDQALESIFRGIQATRTKSKDEKAKTEKDPAQTEKDLAKTEINRANFLATTLNQTEVGDDDYPYAANEQNLIQRQMLLDLISKHPDQFVQTEVKLLDNSFNVKGAAAAQQRVRYWFPHLHLPTLREEMRTSIYVAVDTGKAVKIIEAIKLIDATSFGPTPTDKESARGHILDILSHFLDCRCLFKRTRSTSAEPWMPDILREIVKHLASPFTSKKEFLKDTASDAFFSAVRAQQGDRLRLRDLVLQKAIAKGRHVSATDMQTTAEALAAVLLQCPPEDDDVPYSDAKTISKKNSDHCQNLWHALTLGKGGGEDIPDQMAKVWMYAEYRWSLNQQMILGHWAIAARLRCLFPVIPLIFNKTIDSKVRTSLLQANSKDVVNIIKIEHARAVEAGASHDYLEMANGLIHCRVMLTKDVLESFAMLTAIPKDFISNAFADQRDFRLMARKSCLTIIAEQATFVSSDKNIARPMADYLARVLHVSPEEDDDRPLLVVGASQPDDIPDPGDLREVLSLCGPIRFPDRFEHIRCKMLPMSTAAGRRREWSSTRSNTGRDATIQRLCYLFPRVDLFLDDSYHKDIVSAICEGNGARVVEIWQGIALRPPPIVREERSRAPNRRRNTAEKILLGLMDCSCLHKHWDDLVQAVRDALNVCEAEANAQFSSLPAKWKQRVHVDIVKTWMEARQHRTAQHSAESTSASSAAAKPPARVPDQTQAAAAQPAAGAEVSLFNVVMMLTLAFRSVGISVW